MYECSLKTPRKLLHIRTQFFWLTCIYRHLPISLVCQPIQPYTPVQPLGVAQNVVGEPKFVPPPKQIEVESGK